MRRRFRGRNNDRLLQLRATAHLRRFRCVIQVNAYAHDNQQQENEKTPQVAEAVLFNLAVNGLVMVALCDHRAKVRRKRELAKEIDKK